MLQVRDSKFIQTLYLSALVSLWLLNNTFLLEDNQDSIYLQDDSKDYFSEVAEGWKEEEQKFDGHFSLINNSRAAAEGCFRHFCPSAPATAPLNFSISGSFHLRRSPFHKMNSIFFSLPLSPLPRHLKELRRKRKDSIFFLILIRREQRAPFYSHGHPRLPLSLKSVSRPGDGSRDGAGAIQGAIFPGDTDALK